MTLAKNITARFDKALRFAIWGGIGGAIGDIVSEPFLGVYRGSNSLIEEMIHSSLWFGIIGAGIAVSLLIASAQYLKRGLQIQQALQDGVLLGFVAGAIAGAIAEYTYLSVGPTEFLRVICWGIAGGLLGLGLSFRIPNLGRSRGLGGGLAGGLLGGCLFVFFAVVNHTSLITGRLTGFSAIGFCIGLMIAIVEATFREAWLQIHYNPREVRTVSLGSQPVSIGGDPNLCTIYVHNAPPMALRYQLDQGQILCEDIPTGTTHPLQPGDKQTLGTVTIVLCTANSLPQPNISAQNSPKTVPQPPHHFSLHVKYQDIPLTDGAQLTGKEIPGLEPQVAGGVVAQVNNNPQDPTILGLKNCSHRVWTATLTSGEQKQIESGRSIKLAAGTKINFGSVVGEIRS
ncbi:hypothetical protein F7734_32635 [Scytonema sp. UIC 10036]|uniref:hypothetical protein n=1 Tax=Scytonema sp. UIC 10036 TaxID=2304196 RepID=UPI0012DAE056|nr:hypothetical protein [Scytonema sp. UIC 10036]MUG96834.1 hypothetical protein [Scytonema sp. UIC 10036]